MEARPNHSGGRWFNCGQQFMRMLVVSFAAFSCMAQVQESMLSGAQLPSLLDFELGAGASGAPVGWTVEEK